MSAARNSCFSQYKKAVRWGRTKRLFSLDRGVRLGIRALNLAVNAKQGPNKPPKPCADIAVCRIDGGTFSKLSRFKQRIRKGSRYAGAHIGGRVDQCASTHRKPCAERELGPFAQGRGAREALHGGYLKSEQPITPRGWTRGRRFQHGIIMERE
jgi:hypothetical protein